MTSTAFLLTPEMLVDELARESRIERMEQRVKPSMKQAIEFAAALAGTDTSEFVSTAAFQAAMDREWGIPAEALIKPYPLAS